MCAVAGPCDFQAHFMLSQKISSEKVGSAIKCECSRHESKLWHRVVEHSFLQEKSDKS